MQRKCAVSLCQRCGKVVESDEHILFLCKWATKVWFASPLAAGFFLNSIGSVGGWSMNVKEQIDGGILESDFLAMAIFLAWYIWKARNELVFQSVSSSPYVTVTRALGAWDEFVSAKECLSSGRQGRPPPPSLAIPH